MFFSYFCLALSVIAGAAGQILLKIGALNQVKYNTGFFLEKFTFAGLFVYFMAAIAYIFALRRVPLSIAFPSVSISYFFVSLAAYWFFGENFGLINIVALILISIGIFMLVS